MAIGGQGDGAGVLCVSTALEILAVIASAIRPLKKREASHISIELPCSLTPLATAPHQSMILAVVPHPLLRRLRIHFK